MTQIKPFRFVSKEKYYEILYHNKSLVKISKKEVKLFLVDFFRQNNFIVKDIKKIIKKAKKNVIATDVKKNVKKADLRTRAMQLSNLYVEEKKKFYKNKNVSGYSAGDKQFKYFERAIGIIDTHNTSYKKYLAAQLDGLKFIDNGNGKFPSPLQLCTSTAETRLLDYLRNKNLVQERKDSIPITQKELDTPLPKNSRYVTYACKIKDGIADLRETRYVNKLQVARRGEAASWVLEYQKQLETDV